MHKNRTKNPDRYRNRQGATPRDRDRQKGHKVSETECGTERITDRLFIQLNDVQNSVCVTES